MASPNPSTPLICVAKGLKDKQLMTKFGISFLGYCPVEQWPRHLLETFRQIRKFDAYNLSSFDFDVVAKSSDESIWVEETRDRAKRIADTCAILREDDVSEMEWRLILEELVLARFRLEIKCPNCNKRLWRSEIEAVVESPGQIAMNLERRRQGRHPCDCEPRRGMFEVGRVNRMFSSRADEMILYDPFQNQSKKSAKASSPLKRRPDRIIGFRNTRSFDRRLDPIARRLQDGAGTVTIREMVECTVLNHKSGLLLFPFLVIEAKSERGEPNSACNRQTAFPIWKMLKIQEELQFKSHQTPEYGGSLLWYISYRGAEWSLSGCYTVEKDGKTCYEILDLWYGRINDGSRALQLLLIIDYIFDWARDIYRPMIISQLEALARPLSDDDGKNRLVRTFTDSDVFSLSDKQRTDTDTWIDGAENPAEQPQDEEPTSSTKAMNLETSLKDNSATPADDLDPEAVNGLSVSVQDHSGLGACQEITNESLQKLNCASTNSSASEVGDDKAAELKAAITDSVLTRYQELIAEEPSLLSPISMENETMSASELSPDQEGTPPHPTHDEKLSSSKVEAVEPGQHIATEQNVSRVCASPSTAPPVSSSTPSPSPTQSAFSAPQTRASTPSPSLFLGDSASCSSSKRSLEPENDSRTRKKLKVCPELVGREVIVID